MEPKKRKKPGSPAERKREGERVGVRIARERRTPSDGWKWRGGDEAEGCETSDREGFRGERSRRARKTVSRAQIVSPFPKEKYTVHWKTF